MGPREGVLKNTVGVSCRVPPLVCGCQRETKKTTIYVLELLFDCFVPFWVVSAEH